MPQEEIVPAYEDMTLEELLAAFEGQSASELPETVDQPAMGYEASAGDELQQAVPEVPPENLTGPAAPEVSAQRISASRNALQNRLKSLQPVQ